MRSPTKHRQTADDVEKSKPLPDVFITAMKAASVDS
jgi:beta-phosphoglucomutase-like phosphatase (HAD superfamily)